MLVPSSKIMECRVRVAGSDPSFAHTSLTGFDPEETFAVCRCNACFQEKRTLLSLRVTGESGH